MLVGSRARYLLRSVVMRASRDLRHTLARLGYGLGLLALLSVGNGCTESESSCLYDEASKAVERASAEANEMPCESDEDCTLAPELPSCYPGCGVVLPELALPRFEERLAKFSCERHEPAQCVGRVVPECAAVRAICVAGRCEATDQPASGGDASSRASAEVTRMVCGNAYDVGQHIQL